MPQCLGLSAQPWAAALRPRAADLPFLQGSRQSLKTVTSQNLQTRQDPFPPDQKKADCGIDPVLAEDFSILALENVLVHSPTCLRRMLTIVRQALIQISELRSHGQANDPILIAGVPITRIEPNIPFKHERFRDK